MIEKKISDEMKMLVKQEEKIIIGVSGGPDSMCLLNALFNLKYNIVVAHVNHMIRSDALDDEKFVENFCKKRNIPIHIKRIDVKKIAENSKIGLEEAGREARYDFFNEIMLKEGASKIATAHNKNDVAETVIMNILRGSGINGLKSIKKIREGIFIKPLLDIERIEIEDYCKNNNIEPRIDSTNSDNTYTRNKIRNIVIPYIKDEFNPNIVQTLARMAEIINTETKYLEKQTEIVYNTILIKEDKNEIVLKLKNFNALDLAIRRRLIIYSVEKLFGTSKGIEKIHIDDIVKLCFNNRGNKYLMPNKNLKFLIKNKQIYILKTNDKYDILKNIGG